ncbi:hypothetical protein ACOMHN_010545 [Nucella lapillus]
MWTKDFLQHFGYFPKGRYPLQNFRQARKTAVRTALKKAFEVWSEPSQLTLTFDPVNPDIRVSFLQREHGDGRTNAFDGRGGLLAHAFPPGDQELSGDIHFDSDEKWSVGGSSSRRSKDLLMVAMHEVGHAIGLGHSSRPKDIMYPMYGSYTPDPFLSRHDVKRLRRLYGHHGRSHIFSKRWYVTISIVKYAPIPLPGPHGRSHIFSKRRYVTISIVKYAPIPLPGPHGQSHIFSKRRYVTISIVKYTPIPLPGPHGRSHIFSKRRYVTISIVKYAPIPLPGPHGWSHIFSKQRYVTISIVKYAPIPLPGPHGRSHIFTSGPHGRSHIFSKRYVYRLDGQGVEQGYPVHVRQEFPGAPINPQAVVHVREGTLTFFFKGKRLWRFTDHKLDEGYPRVLTPPFPEKPRAALSVRSRKGYSTVYVFGSRFFWQWNPDTERVSSAFLFISTFWPDLPSKIDAAVHWSDTYIYFFKNNK